MTEKVITYYNGKCPICRGRLKSVTERNVPVESVFLECENGDYKTSEKLYTAAWEQYDNKLNTALADLLHELKEQNFKKVV